MLSQVVEKHLGDVAQLVRALPCHGRGRGFEPRRPRHKPQETKRFMASGKIKNHLRGGWTGCYASYRLFYCPFFPPARVLKRVLEAPSFSLPPIPSSSLDCWPHAW